MIVYRSEDAEQANNHPREAEAVAPIEVVGPHEHLTSTTPQPTT